MLQCVVFVSCVSVRTERKRCLRQHTSPIYGKLMSDGITDNRGTCWPGYERDCGRVVIGLSDRVGVSIPENI